MEIIKIENLSFSYPSAEKNTLADINLSISHGEFVTICGKSGCGKTTLLRLIKPSLSPHGNMCGKILFEEKPIDEMDLKSQASQIGFVMQNPDAQIVTDKVWHELAFGLESLGMKTPEIRARVSEMASFFGIESLFYKNVCELSGGQKQLLNLASVMVIEPSVLILDEPTSQLDPISAQEFLQTISRINRELGTTVILTEHRLEEAFVISDRVIVLDEGRIIANASPKKTGEILKSLKHEMCAALPTSMRVYTAVEDGCDCPLTVRDGKFWLEDFSKKTPLNEENIPKPLKKEAKDPIIELNDVWFRYDKNQSDVIKGLNLKIEKGELFAILGGNGAGKSTALSLISGLNSPIRGKVLINGKRLKEIPNLYYGILGVLPQNPQALFVKKTVYEDLLEMLTDSSDEQKNEYIENISRLCKLNGLLKSHPYDLSGGEQQRAALAKVLLKNPHILLLDEPTKGMDASFKSELAKILLYLKENGVTIVMVSHDIEFCAQISDRCALFFDGGITSIGAPREFFAKKSFYTTAANRMARTLLPTAVLADDIIKACGKTPEKSISTDKPSIMLPQNNTEFKAKKHKSLSLLR